MENNLLVDSSATQEKASVDQTSTGSKNSTDSKNSSSKNSTDSKDSSSNASADTKKSNATTPTKTNNTKSTVSNATSKNSTKIVDSGSAITKGNSYKVTLKDANGKVLSNKKIIFIFGPNNTTYTKITDSNGIASLNINAAAGKTYLLRFLFLGDDDYSASEGSVNLKVQSKSTISGSGSVIHKGNSYKVYLKDADGKALANKKIVFTFGPKGTIYTRTTDSNGMVSLTINAAVGSYALKYAFDGDDYYFASSDSVDLKVQSNTTISGSGSTISKGDSYKVYLKDADGKALANQIITFLFGPDGTKYTRTTDSNGMVSLKINAAAGKTYLLIFMFGGTEYYLSSNGSVNLKVNAPHGNASQYKKGLNEIESLSDAELAKYLKASGYDAINSAIQTLANKLIAGKTSTWDKATAIFNYVRDNIAYSYYSNSQKGAAKTLSSGTGNCCDQANLVVALCRAAGIPARFSHAKNCKFNSGLVTGHVWAQIYIDGVWYTADATSRYNELGNIQNWDTNSFTNLNQYIHLPF